MSAHACSFVTPRTGLHGLIYTNTPATLHKGMSLNIVKELFKVKGEKKQSVSDEQSAWFPPTGVTKNNKLTLTCKNDSPDTLTNWLKEQKQSWHSIAMQSDIEPAVKIVTCHANAEPVCFRVCFPLYGL